MEGPQYQAPPVDPGFNALKAQSQQDDVDAAKAAARRDESKLAARYGELTSGDTSAILARYGAQLALANNFSTSYNPKTINLAG